MYQKNLYQVPVDIETQALLQALRDGRLFIQPASVPACDTRAEVLSIITRIAAFASDESVVLSAWQALLADDARLRSFRLRQHQKTTNWGQSPIGSFRLLCQMLFPDVDAAQADLYRRGCTNYACYEDECLIRNFMMEGCRYE